MCFNKTERKILTGECTKTGKLTASREDNEGGRHSYDNQAGSLRDPENMG